MKFNIPKQYVVMPFTADDRFFFRAIHNVALEKEHWKTGLPHGIGVQRDRYKDRIKTYLINAQDGCCAYCGMDFETLGDSHRDHIAPKAKHPKFIFRPDNIILSCPKCNGLNKKKDLETINHPPHSRYRKCDFIIIHPYYDNPEEHINYIVSSEGVLVRHITEKGRKTIDFFGLDSINFTETRAQCIKHNAYPLDAECIRLKNELLISRQSSYV